MDIDCSARRSGKTQRMIERSARDWLYIVCIDRREVQRVFKLAREQGLDIPFPLTFDEFLRGSYCSRGVRGVLIDNIDVAVQRMSKVPIVSVSLARPESEKGARP